MHLLKVVWAQTLTLCPTWLILFVRKILVRFHMYWLTLFFADKITLIIMIIKMLWRLRNKPETRIFFTVSIIHYGLQNARNPDWKALPHIGRFPIVSPPCDCKTRIDRVCSFFQLFFLSNKESVVFDDGFSTSSKIYCTPIFDINTIIVCIKSTVRPFSF